MPAGIPAGGHRNNNSLPARYSALLLPVKDHSGRSALTYLEFKMIQRSVWIGKSKIPDQFLKDLRAVGLIETVEIFEVGKSGSLRYLK